MNKFNRNKETNGIEREKSVQMEKAYKQNDDNTTAIARAITPAYTEYLA